jgi:glutamate-1-semialdehyde 2,1-aminomutase
MPIDQPHRSDRDEALRERARRVIPNGMYGHQSVARLPEGYPQFFSHGEGSHVWDVDGNEYIDYMCAYGPIVLGHRHPAVERAAAAQQAQGDCFTGPTERIVELAEQLVAITPHADWAWFAKNGTDATTYAVTVARVHTGRRVLMRAAGAYHGASPLWTPGPAGPEDSAHQLTYRFNDLESVRAAADEAAGDLAAIIVSPFRHDAGHVQELPTLEFVQGVRDLCDATGAVLILDDVRAGFRIDLGGSWAPYGVKPDISAYSKAIANGYALAAVAGADHLREATGKVFATGSFWFSGVAMAAAVATISTMEETNAIGQMVRAGTLLREGLAAQARSHGLSVTQSGPVQMPFLSFDSDDLEQRDIPRATLFTSESVKRGAYFHPTHNWFISAAHTAEDVERTLAATDAAFAAVRATYGEG